MGNDVNTKLFHVALFKFISKTFYNRKFRFRQEDFQVFDLGYLYGRELITKNINTIDFSIHKYKNISEVRRELKINLDAFK